ncbi:MAG: hypothetical protein JNK38_01540 [Acidobacteria bacterium]|nr:hypothetical protein [Acidobacteriota bacterium]
MAKNIETGWTGFFSGSTGFKIGLSTSGDAGHVNPAENLVHAVERKSLNVACSDFRK